MNMTSRLSGSFSRSVPAIAHDLNNNVQAVVSALELMRCKIEQGCADDTVTLIERAMTSAESVIKLGRRLMRSEDKDELGEQRFCVNLMIERMRPIFGQVVGPSIDLSLSLAADLQPVGCESLDLENALFNLILNARDAMPSGGKLRVETSRLFVDQQPLSAGPYTTITVADTGVGMSPEVISSAFDPYFTTKDAERGSGLGLPSVKAFAASQGGDVEARSAVGQGTAITILIPEASNDGPLPRMLCLASASTSSA